MSATLQQSIVEIDKDLSPSWIELSNRVRDLSEGIKIKAAGTVLSTDAEHLARETTRLSEHVERMHRDVTDLVEKLELRNSLSESDFRAPLASDGAEVDWEQIHRENHELRSDFMGVLKALFMWRDDPKDLVER